MRKNSALRNLVRAAATLLGSWLVWDFYEPFLLEVTHVLVVFRIGLLGIPVGFVYWFFYSKR
ncbi:hypothetical protein D9M68_698730 [compost metagenome]